MRFVLPILLLLAITSCKKQEVTNRLAGTWNFTKFMHLDGSYTYNTNYTFSFEEGKADAKTFLPMDVSIDGVETSGKYLVIKKGSELVLIYDIYHPTVGDTLKIEDMDKKSLVISDDGGIRFFEKREE